MPASTSSTAQAAPPLASVAPEVPAHIAQAIDRLLAKNPAARFAVGEDVADAMSRDISVAKLDDRPEDVELLMREQRIRRVPVTDDHGSVVGIVSLADFARAAAAQSSAAEAPDDASVSERDVGHTLAAICEPGQRRINPPT